MIISDKYRFVFIAVPKTASSSIEQILREYGRFYSGKQKHLGAEKVKTGWLADWSSYLSFAVIRHPVDWLHSWYKFWTAASNDPKTVVAPRNRLRDITFADFVSRTADNRDRHWMHVGLQANRVCAAKTGELLVSRLLCYDHLREQFPQLLVELGIAATTLPKRNVSKLEQPLPELPADLLAQVRHAWHDDFVLYSRAYDEFAQSLRASGQPVPPARFQPGDAKPQRSRPRAGGTARPELAIEAARRAILKNPDSARLHLRLARLELRAGKHGVAATTLRRTIELDPQLATPYRLLSAVLLKGGDVPQAVRMAREAVARRPNRADLLRHLANVLKKNGEIAEAESVLTRAQTLASRQA